jgi:hypothetical protein
MKTLVLDTTQLLASGEFGATILRWHASMGGPRRDGGRPAPVPKASLYSTIGEGFLFHRGSTDPVVMVAADEWEPAMQVILDLIRLLPASLVTLGAILAFPYFLPQPKTNLHEFTEQLPLALALMRVPRSEAAGDRHAKRMSSWETAPITLRDLTESLGGSARGKETVPLVLQYARDHVDEKLLPISQRVDLVEGPRLRSHLGDPERQGGRDRRKEMWRIGTAMESAALLLQRARGRHVPVNVETAKRAQEYLQARVPDAPFSAAAVPVEPAVVSPAVAALAAAPGQVPPWLQRAEAPARPPPAPAKPEVVPVSKSDDPSLLPARAVAPEPLPVPTARVDPSLAQVPAPVVLPTPAPVRPTPPVASSFPAPVVPARPTAAPVPAPPAAAAPVVVEARGPPALTAADLATLRTQIERDLVRLLEERFATLAKVATAAPPATELAEALHADLDARVDQRIAAAIQLQNAAVARTIQASEERQARSRDDRFITTESRLKEGTAAAVGAELDRRFAAVVEPRLGDVSRRIDETIQRSLLAAREQTAADLERRVAGAIGPKLAEVDHRVDESLQRGLTTIQEQNRAELARALEAQRTTLVESEEAMRAGLTAQLDLHLNEASDREAQMRTEVESRVNETVRQRLDEFEQRRAKETKELEARLGLLVDGRSRETHEKVTGLTQAQEARLAPLVDGKLATLEDRINQTLDGRINEIQEARVHALADLQVRMQSFFEQKLREEQERERQKYLELLARLKGEVESSLSRMVDSSRFDTALREKIGRSLEVFRAETQRALETRIATAEEKLKVDQTEVAEQLARMQHALDERQGDLRKLEESVRGEVDDLDRRTQILSDRLVPVVRKTWLRIAELQQNGSSGEVEVQLNQLRREINRELHRLESDLVERTTEIRGRMETAISNQGRVWLTLIRQLSQLTEDRRAAAGRGMEPPRRTGRDEDIDAALEAMPSLFPEGSAASADPEDDPVNPLDPDPSAPVRAAPAPAPADEDRTTRRRFRRTGR